MRKDFDSDQLRLLLIYRPQKTIGVVGLSNCELIIQGYYRRLLFYTSDSRH